PLHRFSSRTGTAAVVSYLTMMSMMLEPDRDRRRNRDRVVDLNAARFPQDGFDLDLTYVTGRIIVHGFPATGVEHIYRNPRTEVQRLLDTYHESKYKVYNFASEPGRTYPEELFHGRVER
ncbi:unnamed protein product, partial [Laminaria digitata]